MSAYSAAILGTSGLKSYWRLGESSGNPADLGPANLTLTPSGTPTYSVAGAIANDADTAISLSFASSQALGNSSPGSAYSGGSGLSIEGWLSTTDTTSIRTHYTARIKGSGGFVRVTRATTSAVDLLIQISDGTYTLITSATSASYTDGTWNYFVGTWVKSTGAMVLYVNGASAKTGTKTGSLGSATFVAVGQDSNGAEYGDTTIDEVAVYDRALTAAEVTYHYNLGVGIIANDGRSRPGRRLQAVNRAAVF